MSARFSSCIRIFTAGAALAAAMFAGPAAAQTHGAIGSGFNAPNGVAVDGAGNVFVADTGNGAIKEILAPGYTSTVPIAALQGKFSQPAAIAIDTAGNLFVADMGDGTVKEILAAGGYVTVAALAGGFSAPTGIAVDSSENVFVADFGTDHLVELSAADNYGTQITLNLSFTNLAGVAVDAQGNLFTADENNGIQESPAGSGYQKLVTLASGNPNIQEPFAIAIDAQGNLFFTDLVLGQVAEIPAVGGHSNVVPRLGGLDEPEGVAIAANGNLFVADPNNNKGVIDELSAATATGLTTSLSPSTLGAGVTFTAVVTTSSGEATGSVTFLDGAAPLGTVALASGTAAFDTTALPVGSHSITAAYGGDNNFAASTSAALPQIVDPAATAVTLAASVDPSAPGQTVTFTASVPAIGGSVTFTADGIVLGTVDLVSGTAGVSTASLGSGSHEIAASYSGDADFAASDSAPLTQSVGFAATQTSIVASIDPSALNENATFTAFVAGTGGTPAGTVSFLDGTTTLGTVTLSGGIASFTTAALSLGSHPITASYAGDGDFAGSTSAVLIQTVNQLASTTTLAASLDPSSAGAAVIFTATVSGSGGSPTGTVIFRDGTTTLGTEPLISGSASLGTAALAAGSHAITAGYGGDGSFGASVSAPLTQVVEAASVAGEVYGYQNTLGATGIAAADGSHFNVPAPGAVDLADGRLFVADTGNHRVQVIDTTSLAVIATIGTAGASGADNAHFDLPAGAGFDPATGRLFVADTGNHRIQVFDGKSLAYLATLGTAGAPGADNAHFDLPESAFVNAAADQLYIADTGNQRVQIFDAASLAYVATLGTTGAAGSDAAHFDQPADAELDPSTSQILVADSGNARVQLFDAASFALAGTLGVAATPGSDNAHFALPVTVGYDPVSNLVLVADAGANARIQVFDALSYAYVLTLGTTGSPGAGQAQFASPQGIAVDPAHARLFIGDGSNDRVQIFAIAPVATMASVLPGSRSVQLGHPATIFASVVNAGATALDACRVALPATSPAGLSLSYQTTNPATNAPTGTPNTPVTIPGADGVQSFLITLTGTEALSAPGLALDFDCLGAAPAAVLPGIDTLDLVLSAAPTADIIALAATAGDTGIVEVPEGGAAAFAVATINLGVTAPLTVSVDTGTAVLPLAATLCQSNPATGQCLAPPAAALSLSIAAGASPTFSVFLQASGPIAFAPASARSFLRFTDGGGVRHGSTSIAVETVP
jgi:YVTN family beta-propeller protein